MTDVLTARVTSLALELGAISVGVASVDPFGRELAGLHRAKATGRSGPLHFTYDDPPTATDITRSHPWARRLVVVAHGYSADAPPPAKTGALVGRFAVSNQYAVLEKITTGIADELRKGGHRATVLIDDNRLVDRGAAVRAGAGWWGKSTMVLTPGHGPWTLLGSVVTDADLDVTPVMQRSCGSCTACLAACPTGALDDEGLDARRCLSTWLQSRGSIPHWIRPRLGRRIYGCDDCQTACPPGAPAMRRSPRTSMSLPFSTLLDLDDDQLIERFAWWYVPMRDGRYLRRNILVAAGNSREAGAWGQIERHLAHRSSMIRGVAAWAAARSGRRGAVGVIEDRLAIERARETIDELLLARTMLTDPGAYARALAADEWANTTRAVEALGVIGLGDRRPADMVVVCEGDPGPGEARFTGIGVLHRVEEVDQADLAEIVIVHDPHRRLETLRRTARRHTEGP